MEKTRLFWYRIPVSFVLKSCPLFPRYQFLFIIFVYEGLKGLEKFVNWVNSYQLNRFKADFSNRKLQRLTFDYF